MTTAPRPPPGHGASQGGSPVHRTTSLEPSQLIGRHSRTWPKPIINTRTSCKGGHGPCAYAPVSNPIVGGAPVSYKIGGDILPENQLSASLRL